MLNKIAIMGRIVRDPELKRTNAGIAVCTITLAVDRDIKDQPTDWVNVILWRGNAEYVGKYGAKGRMLVVDGRLQSREYTDKNGNKRTAWEVVADHAYFGDRAAGKQDTLEEVPEEEDIPF